MKIMADLTLSSNWAVMTKPQRRRELLAFEKACLELSTQYEDVAAEDDIALTHLFCEGCYTRTVGIPAGVALVGKIHRYDCINIISQGSIRVATEEGVRDIKAPAQFISPAGTKRAGFVLEDCVWTTVHATDRTDPKLVEEDVIVPTYEELDVLLEKRNELCSSSSSSIGGSSSLQCERSKVRAKESS